MGFCLLTKLGEYGGGGGATESIIKQNWWYYTICSIKHILLNGEHPAKKKRITIVITINGIILNGKYPRIMCA